jgi:8-oxo-dGTP pyrophosphatase MutT (NUDIX family)
MAIPNTASPTPIVLAVVRGQDGICVARRSQLVGTSRGLWSVVTGYVEAGCDPVAQAWAEVAEELALEPPALSLHRQYPPLTLTSPTSGKVFLIYPFLFECSPGSTVVLNWEHDCVQWVDPSWLDRSDCVPWQADLVRSLLATDT